MSGFPDLRLRRLRTHPRLRDLVRETVLTANDFVHPIFVRHGDNNRIPIESMPGQFQVTVDLLADEVAEIVKLGIPGILLFGIPEQKDEVGSDAYSEDGLIQRSLAVIRESVPDVLVMTDVCLCEYTDHGHCGTLHDHDGIADVDNDATLDLIAMEAVSHARAGADVIAPSGMMDGMVSAIRSALDEGGFPHIPILSYAAKYCSAFYGPFRDAAESAPQFGDRRSYQMDPANGMESLREVQLDVLEGADMLMVKPALAYLDVVRRIKDAHPEIPLAAYNVSGEYAMIKAAAAEGWLDEKSAALEMLTSIKRAGADMIITYYARDAVRWLGEGLRGLIDEEE